MVISPVGCSVEEGSSTVAKESVICYVFGCSIDCSAFDYFVGRSAIGCFVIHSVIGCSSITSVACSAITCSDCTSVMCIIGCSEAGCAGSFASDKVGLTVVWLGGEEI